jgi:hypothetical protein
VGELTGKGSMLHGMMTAYQKTILLRRSGSFRWLMMRIRWQWQLAVSRLPHRRQKLALSLFILLAFAYN